MKLKVNPDFVKRHLFAAAVFLAMGCWFGYDGIVRYPATPADALYASIEKSAPPATMTPAQLEAFKRQKVKTQLGLMAILLLSGAWVALGVWKACRLDLDPEKLAVKGVDRRRWAKKGILRVETPSGWITLDGWHHLGVAEYEKTLPQPQQEKEA